MDFEKVILQRKMIREYIANKQIRDELITRLIKNAHRAPSAGHTQVQEFIIVKDLITTTSLIENLVSNTFTTDQLILEKKLEFAPGKWLLSSYIAAGIENVPIFIKESFLPKWPEFILLRKQFCK
jgi:nitroreductase